MRVMDILMLYLYDPTISKGYDANHMRKGLSQVNKIWNKSLFLKQPDATTRGAIQFYLKC